MPLATPTNFKIAFSVKPAPLAQVSIPIPLGHANKLEQLYVEYEGQLIRCGAKVLTRWHDNTINWLSIVFQETVTTEISYTLRIDVSRTIIPEKDPLLSIEKTDSWFDVKNSHYLCRLNIQSLSLDIYRSNAHLQQEPICQQLIELFDDSGNKLHWQIDSISPDSYVSLIDGSESLLRLLVKGQGRKSHSEDVLLFSAELSFFSQHSSIKYDFTLHNPKAAQHQDGQWDLGDPSSFAINSLNFVVTTPKEQDSSYQTAVSTPWKAITNQQVRIDQHSSGGENWLSPVHVDYTNSVTHKIKGYQHVIDKHVSDSGDRATPTVATDQFSLTLEQFWQNFPKTMSISLKKIDIALFPKLQTGNHELQAGEKKTHSVWIGTQGKKGELDWIHQPRPVSLASEKSSPNPFIYSMPTSYSNQVITSLIDEGLEGSGCFFEKREQIDEYGWRNFGDLYADHETAGYSGDKLFVSHYNNQYDPIYGFLKQYLRTGDSGWFELADDLAKHVKDIDIYHTKDDKKEYNGGLFWHTDHYLEAFTSSHRSYSKHQSSGAYHDHAGGGGPGGQHCYTTGLKLHYCITGAESSKQAVLTLSKWITNVYEGSGTCLELLLAFKNRHIIGLKNHFTGQYPLDRGTANYLIALLDSYELTQQISYLHQVETILKNSMHPNEDLTHRDLHDVESNWFYTVLLQALSRYLFTKQLRQELDDNFYYCRDCLLNFADWMVKHEYPYLDKPEILEYPNDTWTAQDLRKAHIFAAAYYYSNEEYDEYLDKAHFFEQYVATKLNSSATKTYTRILVLLMQNHGAVDFYKTKQGILFDQRKDNWPAADYQRTTVPKGLIKTLVKRLAKLSIKNEISWLKTRLS